MMADEEMVEVGQEVIVHLLSSHPIVSPISLSLGYVLLQVLTATPDCSENKPTDSTFT